MANSVTLAGIVITLVEGYPICENNRQTWRYSVAFENGVPPTPEISNFAFELCNPEHVVVDFSPTEGGEFDLFNAEPCLEDLGATRQMKWNVSNDSILADQVYEFTLNGCFNICNINVAVKAGNDPETGGCTPGEIFGPCCTPTNGNGDGVRGIDFSNFKDTNIEY